MSATEEGTTSRDASVGGVDMKFEVQVIPVSDVDRSKHYYLQAGWRLDEDVAPMDGLRIVQFTPPGSGTSVDFGQGLTTPRRALPRVRCRLRHRSGTRGARQPRHRGERHLARPSVPRRGAPARRRPRARQLRIVLLLQRPRRQPWLVQEVTTRRPGRMNTTETGYVSTADLESALRRAEAAHREHEKRNGRSHLFHRSDQDTHWPAWYAAYMVAEQAGTDLPS